jgi:hypothetical protein
MAQALGFAGSRDLFAKNNSFQIDSPMLDAAVAGIVAGY